MYVALISLCFCDSDFLFASLTTNYSCIIYLLIVCTETATLVMHSFISVRSWDRQEVFFFPPCMSCYYIVYLDTETAIMWVIFAVSHLFIFGPWIFLVPDIKSSLPIRGDVSHSHCYGTKWWAWSVHILFCSLIFSCLGTSSVCNFFVVVRLTQTVPILLGNVLYLTWSIGKTIYKLMQYFLIAVFLSVNLPVYIPYRHEK